MRDVAITVTPSTEKLEITSGKLVYLDQHAITVTNGDGDDFDDGRAYRLTVKRRGRYSGSAITYASQDTIDGATLTFTLDLNVDALGTLLGDQQDVDFCIDVTDGTDTTYGIDDAVPVQNRVRRPADTAATNPSENTYTDAEIDSMVGEVRLPEATVEDSDGTLAQVLSGVWAKVTRASWLGSVLAAIRGLGAFGDPGQVMKTNDTGDGVEWTDPTDSVNFDMGTWE